jgi:hypothetical protein
MPSTRATFGRNRAITSSALDLRPGLGLSEMNIEPVLIVDAPKPPMLPIA